MLHWSGHPAAAASAAACGLPCSSSDCPGMACSRAWLGASMPRMEAACMLSTLPCTSSSTTACISAAVRPSAACSHQQSGCELLVWCLAMGSMAHLLTHKPLPRGCESSLPVRAKQWNNGVAMRCATHHPGCRGKNWVVRGSRCGTKGIFQFHAAFGL